MAKKTKADHRAETLGKPWAGIPHVVLNSLAYLHCDLWERAILVELVLGMNGYNNGSIGLSQRQIADRLRTSNFRRIGRSVAGLMEKGLIDVSAEGQWKQRMARQYRLTFVNTGSNGRYHQATNDYRNWRPGGESGAETASAIGADPAEAVSSTSTQPAEAPSAAFNDNPPKLSFGPAEPVSSLISKPYPKAQNQDLGWWSADRIASARIAILDHLALAAGLSRAA